MERMMKTSETKTKRQGNFELLRIISMVMIVTLHYLKKGGLLSANEGSVVYYFAWALEALCLISVNSYVFISGYFTKSKTFKLNKMLDLWIQTLFISVCIYLIAGKAGVIKGFTWDSFLASFLPITTNSYWFITTYFVFLAIAPFLVYITDSINQYQHKIVVFTLLFITSVLPTVFFKVEWLRISKGYHIIWFITLFFLASYIRKYDCFKRKPAVYGLLYFLCCTAAFALRFAVKAVSLHFYKKDLGETFFMRYNMFFIFLASLFLFLAFKNISIKGEKINKIITFFSSAAVYVYIIHEAPSIRTYYWKNIVKPTACNSMLDLLLNYIVSVGAIYIGCTLIGKLLVFLYKLIRADRLTIIVSNKITAFAKRKIITDNEKAG